MQIPDDVKLCNCARCNKELTGRASEEWYFCLLPSRQAQVPPLVAGRYRDRPYCTDCLPVIAEPYKGRQLLSPGLDRFWFLQLGDAKELGDVGEAS